MRTKKNKNKLYFIVKWKREWKDYWEWKMQRKGENDKQLLSHYIDRDKGVKGRGG